MKFILIFMSLCTPLTNWAQSSTKNQQIEYTTSKEITLKVEAKSSSADVLNQKASDVSKKPEYAKIDSSVRVIILERSNEWAKIQVTHPEWLKESHKGWVIASNLEKSPNTTKVSGWIRHTCNVFQKKDSNAKPVGYLSIKSHISGEDMGDGWIKLTDAPAKDSSTDEFIDYKHINGVTYIQSSNFTTTMPGKW